MRSSINHFRSWLSLFGNWLAHWREKNLPKARIKRLMGKAVKRRASSRWGLLTLIFTTISFSTILATGFAQVTNLTIGVPDTAQLTDEGEADYYYQVYVGSGEPLFVTLDDIVYASFLYPKPSSYIITASITSIPIAAPTNLIASAVSSSQINLSWTDNSDNEDGFVIERRTIGGEFNPIDTVGANITFYHNTDLTDGARYYYRVYAYSGTNKSNYSNEANATTPMNPPSNLTATTISTNQINLTWTDNSASETGYRIERKTGAGGTYTEIGTVGANVTTYNDTGLSGGRTYYYRVRGYNSLITSDYSNEARATTGRLVAISDTSAAPGETLRVPIRVSDATGIAGVEIKVTYNPNILTAFGAQTTALTSGFAIADSISPGKIAISLASATGPEYPIDRRSTLALGQYFQTAGRSLKASRMLRYGGNLVGYMGTLVGWRIEETTEEYWWGTETRTEIEWNPLGIGLSVASSVLSLMATHRVGAAGERLLEASTILPPQQRFLLAEVGENLKTHRSLTYGGAILSYGGMVITAESEDLRMADAGLLIMLSGVVLNLMAIGRVGSAGEGLQLLSESFSEPLYQQLIYEAGEDLRTYSSRTWTGLGLGVMGAVAFVLGVQAENEPIAILGLLSILGGHVVTSWVAPSSIGSAGKKLENAGNLMMLQREHQ